ncbi:MULTISPECIES: ComEA family DNA-binding protein [unclassified Enterococcus]|uniref:ComEA family DNA-binding protein n=1 Tax=unclassified Enterococcus TaxID=2608891 RepID=UPI000B706D23|nr:MULTISPECIES: helix-hairpin-helix domain-containing protein [unclassified Enterococcus]OTO67761.1 hypothetical protein A5865_003440 [Enterococcus sp. 12E11_DIV0728]OUZ15699.1 hypothetical protein A5868_000610 [Enterococcus sp. 12F9_DIV0723]
MKKYIGKLLLVVILISTLVPFKTASAEETGVVDTRIDINHCQNYYSLMELDGVGENLAKKIIEARPYSSLDDLKKVNGIGDAKLNGIKAQGLAYAATPEKIYINYASEYELQYLEGIGASLAQKIIDQRPFASVDELSKKVVGIGSAKLQAIKSQGIAYVEPTPVFPAKIKDVFPDTSLADQVAKRLIKNTSDEVTEEELLKVRELSFSNYSELKYPIKWEGLQYLTELESFECNEVHFSEGGDFNRFKQLNNLNRIRMVYTDLNLSLISEMKNLRYLFLTDIDQQELETISKMTWIESLDFFYLMAQDLSPIGKLVNLKGINVLYESSRNEGGTVIDDSWENLSKLGYVRFEWGGLSDVRGLTKLQEKYGILEYYIVNNAYPDDQILK